MNETDDALLKAGLPPLDDEQYALPRWADPVVDDVAHAERAEACVRDAGQDRLRYFRLFMILFAFTGVTFFAGLTLYWFGEPYGSPVVEFKDGITVLNYDGSGGPVVVRPGQSIVLHGSYCKTRDTMSTIIRREFHDELVYQLPKIITNVPKGCDDNLRTVLKIPENLPPDVYSVYFTFVYQINPIKTVTYQFQTNQFTVVAPTVPA